MMINVFNIAVTLALNLENINKHPQRISKIKPSIQLERYRFSTY